MRPDGKDLKPLCALVSNNNNKMLIEFFTSQVVQSERVKCTHNFPIIFGARLGKWQKGVKVCCYRCCCCCCVVSICCSSSSSNSSSSPAYYPGDAASGQNSIIWQAQNLKHREMPARQEKATSTIQNAYKLYIYPAYVGCN